jgi:hypothetical protein
MRTLIIKNLANLAKNGNPLNKNRKLKQLFLVPAGYSS